MPLKLFEEPLKGVKHIVGVAAGKGGVGKSTVSVGLGQALARLGYKVGILDADVYGPSIRKMMWEGVLPYQDDGKLYPGVCGGIKVMSMAFFRKEWQAEAVRAPVASSIVSQFLKEISWGDLDFLLIDFPPGTGDIQLTLCQQAKLSGAVMVTTPQEVAVMDVRKAIDLFRQVNVPILGVVENMSYFVCPGTKEQVFIFGQGGGKRLASSCEVPFLGEIPLDSEICLAAEEGKPSSHQAFIDLAEQLVEQIMDGDEVKFYQIDSQHLVIEWKDGVKRTIRFAELQKKCQCAGCNKPIVDEEVAATKVEGIGRYAIKVQFTSGCSRGLYPFNMLRDLS